MNELFKIGFTEKEISDIYHTNDDLAFLSENQIKIKIDFLKEYGCEIIHIYNIIFMNPYFLSRSIYELRKLMTKLLEIGISPIHLLIDSNPLLLNMEEKQIERFISEKSPTMSLKEIADLIEMNPFIIDECE